MRRFVIILLYSSSSTYGIGLFVFFASFLLIKDDYGQGINSISLKEHYLSENFFSISDCNSDISFIDSKVYIIGEAHSEKTSLSIELAVLKKLKKKQNINILLLEFAPSNEYFINYYLHSKSNRVVYKNRKVKFFTHNGEKKYYRPLLELYENDSANEKFEIKAVDMEFDFKQSLAVLWMIIQDNKYPIPDKLKEVQYKIGEENKNRKNTKLYPLVEYVIKDFEDNGEAYEKSLLYGYKNYKSIIKGLKAGLFFDKQCQNINTYEERFRFRENYIYENVKAAISENPNGKFFGSFGLTHVIDHKTLWYGLNEWTSCFEKLHLEYGDQVCRMFCYYSRQNEWGNNQIVSKADKPLFMKYAKTKWTLFNMKNSGSPFNCVNQYIIFIK